MIRRRIETDPYFFPEFQAEVMRRSRVATALVFLVGSLLVSAVLWWYFETLLFFLFVPFVPFLFRRGKSDREQEPPLRECPQCGFQTRTESYEYCPRDGRRLQQTDRSSGESDRYTQR